MEVPVTLRRPIDKALFAAIRAKNLRAVRQALDSGASPNAREMRLTLPNLRTKDSGGKPYAGSTALLVAVQDDNLPIVQLLLAHGANPNSTAGGTTPLVASFASDGVTLMKLLIRYGANVHGTEEGDLSPLTIAANHGTPADMEVLVKAGANINGNSVETPLMMAAGTPDNENLLWLLRHGADINLKLKGSTALDSAEVGSETWKILRARGAKGLSIAQRKQKEKEDTLYFQKQSKDESGTEARFVRSLPQKDKFWRPEDNALLRVFLEDFAREARKEKLAWPTGNRVGVYPMTAGMERGGFGVNGDDLETDLKQLEITLDIEASGLVRNRTRLRVPRSLLPTEKYYFRKADDPMYELVPPEGTFLSVSFGLPGYSKDYQRAALSFSFTPTPHGAVGVYFFKKVHGAWKVVWRNYSFYV